MRLIKNSLIPIEIQACQKWLIAGFLNFGAKDYDGILSKSMFSDMWDLFEFLKENGTNKTPEYFIELAKIENATELLDLTQDIYSRYDLPKYAKQLFEWYTTQTTEKSIKNIENIRKVYDRIDTLYVGKENWGIMDLFRKVEEEIETAKNRWDEPLWHRTGFKTIDDNCEGLQPWTVMTINAYANTGKSKMAYSMANNFLKNKLSVAIFSLEVTANKVMLNLLANWYKMDYNTIAKWKIIFSLEEYYEASKKLSIITENTDLEDIIKYCDINKPDIVIIDFVQNIAVSGTSTEYERMSAIAVGLQKMAIRNNIAVLDLSQISSEGYEWKVGQRIPAKGSGWLVESTDVAIMLYKREWVLKMAIAKNKFWPASIETTLDVNFSKWIFKDLWTAWF